MYCCIRQRITCSIYHTGSSVALVPQGWAFPGVVRFCLMDTVSYVTENALPYTRGQQTLKGQVINIFSFWAIHSVTTTHLCHGSNESSQGLQVNKWVWLCSKTIYRNRQLAWSADPGSLLGWEPSLGVPFSKRNLTKWIFCIHLTALFRLCVDSLTSMFLI